MVLRISRFFLISISPLFLLPISDNIQCYVSSGGNVHLKEKAKKHACYISDNGEYGHSEHPVSCGTHKLSKFCCSTDACNNPNGTWIESAYKCESVFWRKKGKVVKPVEDFPTTKGQVLCDGQCFRNINLTQYVLSCAMQPCSKTDGCETYNASETCCCKGNDCMAKNNYPTPAFFIEEVGPEPLLNLAGKEETPTGPIDENVNNYDEPEPLNTNIEMTTVEELPDYFDPKSNGEYQTFDDDGFDDKGGETTTVAWILLFFVFFF